MRVSVRAEVSKIAAEVAADVYRRRSNTIVNQLVGAALDRELPRRVRSLPNRSAARVSSSERRAMVKAVVTEVTAVVTSRLDARDRKAGQVASEAAMEAVMDLAPTIMDMAENRVADAIAAGSPSVIKVELPDSRKVEIGDDVHEKLPDLLVALHAKCHVLLVGPAGTGKSMLAKHAADALALPFQALSLGPTTPMSKVFGYYDAHGQYHDTPFRRAFEHGGVMLLDELDNGHPGLLGELNQALALRSCAFADGMVDAHDDFRLVATGNTYGTGGDHQYVGRQALDAATLDRFIVIDVPIDPGLEQRLTLAHAPSRRSDARQVLAEVRRLRTLAISKQLPVTFSPRASIDAAKLLEAGATVDQALRWRVTRGLSDPHRVALGLAVR